MQRSLKYFSILTTIGMLFVLLGGALVTKTDSGLGCGRTFPLCNGEIIPTDVSTELMIEFSHRIVSGTVGLMVLVLSIWTWRKIGHIRETKFLSILSFTFLLLQGLIGAASVVWGQSDFILALHFGISLISFASVLLLTLLILEVDKKFAAEKLIIDKKMTGQTIAVSIYSYIVIYSGALVRHTDASLVCGSWPFCTNSGFTIPENIYEWIQMGHRTAAGLLFLWIAWITFHAVTAYKHEKVLYIGWVTALALISLQVLTGALTIVTRLNLMITLAHALFISCFFGVLSYFLLLVSRSSKNQAVIQASKQKQVVKKNIPNIY
ncbi:heme A synthase [Bacillaceae bacterium Marseille-Q3522]|nr:heme A synthase [Bacillaceae bacterium Marseille-Q3522]